MTREIKFRAWMKIWDEDEPVKGKMFYQILPTGDFKTWIIAFDNDDKYDGDFTVGEDIELMQYTGLKDKNGKEIYEGDMCIHKQVAGGLLSPSKAKNVQIVWTELHNGWICDDGKYQYSMQTSQLEIIGNIYENPELLKD